MFNKDNVIEFWHKTSHYTKVTKCEKTSNLLKRSMVARLHTEDLCGYVPTSDMGYVYLKI